MHSSDRLCAAPLRCWAWAGCVPAASCASSHHWPESPLATRRGWKPHRRHAPLGAFAVAVLAQRHGVGLLALADDVVVAQASGDDAFHGGLGFFAVGGAGSITR